MAGASHPLDPGIEKLRKAEAGYDRVIWLLHRGCEPVEGVGMRGVRKIGRTFDREGAVFFWVSTAASATLGAAVIVFASMVILGP